MDLDPFLTVSHDIYKHIGFISSTQNKDNNKESIHIYRKDYPLKNTCHICHFPTHKFYSE